MKSLYLTTFIFLNIMITWSFSGQAPNPEIAKKVCPGFNSKWHKDTHGLDAAAIKAFSKEGTYTYKGKKYTLLGAAASCSPQDVKAKKSGCSEDQKVYKGAEAINFLKANVPGMRARAVYEGGMFNAPFTEPLATEFESQLASEGPPKNVSAAMKAYENKSSICFYHYTPGGILSKNENRKIKFSIVQNSNADQTDGDMAAYLKAPIIPTDLLLKLEKELKKKAKEEARMKISGKVKNVSNLRDIDGNSNGEMLTYLKSQDLSADQLFLRGVYQQDIGMDPIMKVGFFRKVGSVIGVTLFIGTLPISLPLALYFFGRVCTAGL